MHNYLMAHIYIKTVLLPFMYEKPITHMVSKMTCDD